MDFTLYNWIDFAIIIFITLSVIIGLIRGLVKEALSLVTWIVAIWVSIRFAEPASQLFTSLISSHTGRYIAAFLLLFIVTMILGGLVSYLISQVVKQTGLGGTDRTLGILFGFARGVLVVALLLLVATLSHAPEQQSWKESQLIPYFKPLVTWLHDFLPEKLDFDLE